MRFLGVPLLAFFTLSVFAGCEETSNRPIGGAGGTAASGGSGSGICAPACQTGFVCDASSSTCVECTQNSHCTGGQSCDTANKKCVNGAPSSSGGGGGQGGEGAETGGQGGEPASGGTESGGGGTGGGISECEPKVSLLIQRSGAMFNFPNAQDNWWKALTDALDSKDEDLLDEYAGALELSTRTFFMTNQEDQCLKGGTNSGPIKKNGLAKFLDDERAAHEGLLENDAKVDAPLVEAMTAAAEDLGPGGGNSRRYLLLVISGNPDACGEIDTECVTDDAVKKVQELREAGIRVRVLYLKSEGRFDGYPQALANAGRGYGIPDFLGGACGSELEFADSPMLAPYGSPDNIGELKSELGALFETIAVCD